MQSSFVVQKSVGQFPSKIGEVVEFSSSVEITKRFCTVERERERERGEERRGEERRGEERRGEERRGEERRGEERRGEERRGLSKWLWKSFGFLF